MEIQGITAGNVGGGGKAGPRLSTGPDDGSTIATDLSADTPPTGGSRSSRVPRLWPIVVLGLVGLIAWRLGPSLLGLRVFAGLDTLTAALPWRHPPTSASPLYNGDTVDSMLPRYLQLADRLRGGDRPLWDSLSGAGQPLLSLPDAGIGNPVNWPLLLFGTDYGLALTKLLQVLVAVAGMTVWLRLLGVQVAAGLLAGSIFATSAFFVSFGSWTGQSGVAALLPATFWAVEFAMQRRTFRSTVPLAAVVAALLFSGFPAVAGHALYAAGAYFLVRCVSERRREGRGFDLAVLLRVPVAVVLGVGVAAVQFLPFLRRLGDLDLGYREGHFGAEMPVDSLASVLFGSALSDGRLLSGVPAIEWHSYVGVTAFLLALIAWTVLPRTGPVPAVVGYLAVLTGVSAMLIWWQTPLVTWIGELPVFQGNPIPRIRNLFAFALAASAGFGADALIRRRFVDRAWTRPVVVAVAGGAVLVTLSLGVPLLRGETGPVTRTVWLDVLLSSALVGTLAVVVVRAAGRRAVGGSGGHRGMTVLLTLAVLVPGTWSVGYFWPTADPEQFYPVTETSTFLADHQGTDRVVTKNNILQVTASSVFGIRDLSAHALQPRTWTELFTAVDPNAAQSPTYFTLSTSAPEVMLAPGLDRFGVRYAAIQDFETPLGVWRESPRAGVAGTLVLAPGGQMEVPLPPGPLRAVEVHLAEPVEQPTTATLTVRIRDAAGAPVIGGEIRLDRTGLTIPDGSLVVPLAGEDLPAAGADWTVTMELSGAPGEDLTLVAYGGRPYLAGYGSQDDGLRVVQVADGVTVLERLSALPRVRWASQVLVVADPIARAATVGRTALPPSVMVADGPITPGGGGAANLRVLSDSGDEVTVAVGAQSFGYLVVADGMQEGFAASVDGVRVDLVNADHAFVGVPVPAGKHVVEVWYEAPGLAVGGLISLICLALLVAAVITPWILPRVLRRRPVPHSR